MGRTVRALTVATLLVALTMLVIGCASEPEPKLEPKVSPPAIKTAGVLKAGVDLDTPPYAGVDQGKKAGIDVDVAAALASQLGLTVEYVDVKPSEAATALAQGDADVVLSVPFGDAALTTMTLAGTYLNTGPAAFIATEGTASVEPSMTLDTLSAAKVAAQRESAAYWLLLHQMGEESIAPFETLRTAVEALDAGEVEVLAGDAIVAAYIARDFPNVQYAGQLGPASPLGVAVAGENTALADSVRGALDTLAAEGVLDTIRRTWVGDLPPIEVADVATETATPAP